MRKGSISLISVRKTYCQFCNHLSGNHGKNGCLAIQCECGPNQYQPGCHIHPSCITCPLPKCIFEDPEPEEKIFVVKYTVMKDGRRRWGQEEDDYLRKWVGSWSLRKIGKSLDRTEQSVKDRCVRLGLRLEDSGFVTITEAARLYSCPHTRILRLIKTGAIKASKAGHQYRIKMTHLEKYQSILQAPRRTWKSDEGHHTRSLDRIVQLAPEDL